MVKAIVVDDEPPARRELIRLLAVHKNVKVVGEAADLETARGLLARTRPDVVFLDIRLGKKSGFDLLTDVDDETAVVFVTAYDHYAVKAFDASALDYLVKPVDSTRLKASIAKIEKRADVPTKSAPALYSRRNWVFLDNGDVQEFLRLSDITHIVAEEGGSLVYSHDGKTRRVPRTLSEWESTLDSGDFARVHRSTIVNLRHVQHVERWFHYSYRIYLLGQAEPVTMSRRHASRIRELLR